MTIHPLLSLTLLLVGSISSTQALALDVGDPAPDFSAKSDTGQTWKLADHVGKSRVIVYFYPAAMTGGCTRQACGYRDAKADLTKNNAIVVGVSGDRVEGLSLFKQAENLNFPLLSDSDGGIAKAFGVPVRGGGSIQRVVDGKDHELVRDVSTARWTFIIGLDGKIAHVDSSVKAAGDSARVLEVLAK